jgi:hypothetical protein
LNIFEIFIFPNLNIMKNWKFVKFGYFSNMIF